MVTRGTDANQSFNMKFNQVRTASSAPKIVGKSEDNRFWFSSELTDWMPKLQKTERHAPKGLLAVKMRTKAFRKANDAIQFSEKIIWTE